MFGFRSVVALMVLACGQVGLSQALAAGADAGRVVISAADLQEDVAVLREAYEALHPGLYRYNTRAQMDADFEALRVQLNHEQTLQDAYLAFSVFAAKIKCGHTYANFFNQPDWVAERLFKGRNRVPYSFVWIGHRMIVTADFTTRHQLSRGTEVLAINGVRVETILTQLMTVARADGSNDAKRVAWLGVSGEEEYEPFDIFFPMFFPTQSTTMKLRVREPGDKGSRTIKVDAMSYEQRVAPMKQRATQPSGGPEVKFEWRYLPDGSAYLRMPTWSLYNSKWDWKSWLNMHLDELADKNPPGLVLDIRGNEGGLDAGNLILSRLVHEDVVLSTPLRLVRYREVPEDVLPYVDTWDPSFKNWGTAAVELVQPWPTVPPVHYFRLKRVDDDAAGDRIKPEGRPYSGKVFVLVDANNSSATFQFAQIVQQDKLGLLVGETTGGNQRGINGGAFLFLRLPKSKIEMDIPLIGNFPRTEQPDAGLMPDLVVAPSASDIAAGRDAALVAIAKTLKAGGGAKSIP